MFNRSDLTPDEIEELCLILESDDLSYIQSRVEAFYRKYNILFNFKRDFLRPVRNRYKHMMKDNKISDSLFATINGESSYIWMTAVGIIDVASMTFLSASLVTAAISLLTLGVGIYFFTASYKERQRQKEKIKNAFDLVNIKLDCANCLLKHFQNTNTIENAPAPVFNEAFTYERKDKYVKAKPAVGAAVLTVSMLLSTYAGVIIILTAIGATAALSILSGPIGIGIAIGVALAIGVYCGYKQYQTIINEDKTKKLNKHQNSLLQSKIDYCNELMAEPRHEHDQKYEPVITKPQRHIITHTAQNAEHFQEQSALTSFSMFPRRRRINFGTGHRINHLSPKSR